jgi:phosphoribosylaminoimidazole-succinocarboxamide synthase
MSFGSQTRVLLDKKMARRRQVHEGRTKSIFEGSDEGTFVLHFKDTHPLNQQPDISGKGVINNRLSALLFERLDKIGIETHFIRLLNMREQLVRVVDVLPFYVDVHNVPCDDFKERFGLELSSPLGDSLIDFRLKNKQAHDPILSEQHLVNLGFCTEEEIERVHAIIQRVNDFLRGQFSALHLHLYRYRLEFGRLYVSEHLIDARLLLADEMSLDSCRVYDTLNQQRLDCYDQSNELAAHLGYHEIAKRFGLISSSQESASFFDTPDE